MSDSRGVDDACQSNVGIEKREIETIDADRSIGEVNSGNRAVCPKQRNGVHCQCDHRRLTSDCNWRYVKLRQRDAAKVEIRLEKRNSG